MISEANAVSFGAWNCDVAGLMPPFSDHVELFWQLGGNPGGPRDQQERRLGIRSRFLYDFTSVSGLHFVSFSIILKYYL